MKMKAMACAALLAPAAAFAQVTYSEARIVARDDGVLSREELRTCMARDEALAARRDRLSEEQAGNDREAADITRAGQALAEELRALDSRDVAAVAAYNARSAEHNRRVEDHNRRVAAMNARAAAINGDSASLDSMCARPFLPYDRDVILRERGSLR